MAPGLPVIADHIHISQEQFTLSLVAATKSHLVAHIIINQSTVSPNGSQ